jgi:hypothetical protein
MLPGCVAIDQDGLPGEWLLSTPLRQVWDESGGSPDTPISVLAPHSSFSNPVVLDARRALDDSDWRALDDSDF